MASTPVVGDFRRYMYDTCEKYEWPVAGHFYVRPDEVNGVYTLTRQSE